ncbi:Protein HAIKU1 [Hibiscus syriacus]|uniref:Protein HAIKU1 n=1 Tax=Hibiscus syriacus TaxID=106335 RepID=A0A6A2Y6J3_HIBSY|nr:protein HAIKU1-like [Hibiscus syriacus]KAE8676965.1 Protein HAIKU1 [Hibiscus syriacus]
MDDSKNRLNDPLGVSKTGKNIKKSPLHQPNFAHNGARLQPQPQPQPQVYNISKNDFRSFVQQLTGSPSRNDPLPRPPQNPPKPQSMRLQKIRPPPLTPMNLPHVPVQVPAPVPAHAPSPGMLQPMVPVDAVWTNTAESPISAYMRYLQTSLIDPSPLGKQGQPNALSPSSGGVNGSVPPLRPNLSSPRMNGPALLPSPTSQFLLPSPTGYMNLLSSRSPNPLLSPGIQFPPMTPNFGFSPMVQSGILGPGPQPPASPGLAFPLSPSFFSFPSPTWRG